MTVFLCMIILCVIAAGVLICGIVTQYFPVTEQYEITSAKIRKNYHFILLADLHAVTHGRENEKLLSMVRSAEPDFICLAGDMTVKSAAHTDRVLSLLKELRKDYPVYYSPGNHEIRMPEYDRYKEELAELGVHYLENEVCPVDEHLILYGLDLPEYWYHKCWQKRVFTEEHLREMLGACREESFSLLLAHNPEYGEQYAAWGADLTLSGHVHGGIMRLPLLGGVISPSLRLFPHYDAGLFEEGGRNMIVSRGLGLHHIRLRFFNRPEVSVINLTCQQEAK